MGRKYFVNENSRKLHQRQSDRETEELLLSSLSVPSKPPSSIFYDELSDCYELLNYSQHGTRVDEVLYSLDTAAMAARFPAKKLRGQDISGDPAMASGESFEAGGCYC